MRQCDNIWLLQLGNSERVLNYFSFLLKDSHVEYHYLTLISLLLYKNVSFLGEYYGLCWSEASPKKRVLKLIMDY